MKRFGTDHPTDPDLQRIRDASKRYSDETLDDEPEEDNTDDERNEDDAAD